MASRGAPATAPSTAGGASCVHRRRYRGDQRARRPSAFMLDGAGDLLEQRPQILHKRRVPRGEAARGRAQPWELRTRLSLAGRRRYSRAAAAPPCPTVRGAPTVPPSTRPRLAERAAAGATNESEGRGLQGGRPGFVGRHAPREAARTLLTSALPRVRRREPTPARRYTSRAARSPVGHLLRAAGYRAASTCRTTWSSPRTTVGFLPLVITPTEID
ncbi:unnamed protein product [Urochloa humidicola]